MENMEKKIEDMRSKKEKEKIDDEGKDEFERMKKNVEEEEIKEEEVEGKL